ncbi:hypothetical protein [Streptomyces sp. 2112.3]|uniref:hypothetical protein n=1 Tax=Streptomyces sp. 2112.3 TaxID=1881023 RepID=UPI0011600A3A|nr:hypothetical protein [Streptomyces sp. 2112.3]
MATPRSCAMLTISTFSSANRALLWSATTFVSTSTAAARMASSSSGSSSVSDGLAVAVTYWLTTSDRPVLLPVATARAPRSW